MIRIIAVGRKHETWIEDGLSRYQKRLRAPWDVQWRLVPHSAHEEPVARRDESQRILACLNPTDYVVLLDETGKSLDSPALSQLCEQVFTSSRQLTIIIGGAYGVDERLQARADHVVSLSKLVFPHQLVRLIVIEQVYRAQEIAHGGNYHHR